MIRIHELKINTKALKNLQSKEELKNLLKEKAENKLRLSKGTISDINISRESLDAREKPVIYRVFSLDLLCEKSDEWLSSAANKAHIRYDVVKSSEFEILPLDKEIIRPVVAGFGPSGMFAALILAKAGARPVILERGASMEKRIEEVEAFWRGEKLNLVTNVQFGEGGAGTFSDGKLTTGTKSPYTSFILNIFADFGANPEITYKQKPHIGSDVLRKVVVNMRKEIERLGGEVLFETALSDIEIKDSKVSKVYTNTGKSFDTDCLILCLGHSARDTAKMLYEKGLKIEQKPFSMGLRIEHSQKLIDLAQYAQEHEKLGIGPADYKLNVKTSNGRGVYTFCMCPGGLVINASSHEGCVVTNGMSNSKRDEKTANSALLCDVRTEDFGSDHPLAGMAFQEKYEHLAYIAGGSSYALPKETVKDFKSPKSLMDSCLPDFVCESLREALPMLDKKLSGFDNGDAMLYGIESRSSSPIRIKRDAESLIAMASDESDIKGLYPCGEGAGYAGGIMSAAADGVRSAVTYLSSLQEQESP